MVKKKIKRINKFNNFISIMLLAATLFMSIGYASINSITMNIIGNITVNSQEGIFITDVKLLNGTGEVISYSNTVLGTNTTLLDNSNSEVIYEITVYNSTEEDVPYFGEIYDKEDNSLFYTNPNIEYEVSISKETILKSKDYIIFTITFKYKNGIVSEEKNLESYIQFVFLESEYLYDYTGEEKTFSIPINGVYKLEVWGGQGGSYSNTYYGGYGGYSVGEITLEKDQILNVVVGGQGTGGYVNVIHEGGYNGGGNTKISTDSPQNRFVSSGGGATHISVVDENGGKGLLFSLNNIKENILIVAGAGGGSYYHVTSPNYRGIGGSGGGYIGLNGSHNGNYGANEGTGGSQTAAGHALNYPAIGAGSFGLGGSVTNLTVHGSAGGSGYYGGGASAAGTINEDAKGNSSGGGGSGYIGNENLINKTMYCYNCKESSDIEIRTISTTNVSTNPISNYAKMGNGYAKITLISIN